MAFQGRGPTLVLWIFIGETWKPQHVTACSMYSSQSLKFLFSVRRKGRGHHNIPSKHRSVMWFIMMDYMFAALKMRPLWILQNVTSHQTTSRLKYFKLKVPYIKEAVMNRWTSLLPAVLVISCCLVGLMFCSSQCRRSILLVLPSLSTAAPLIPSSWCVSCGWALVVSISCP